MEKTIKIEVVNHDFQHHENIDEVHQAMANLQQLRQPRQLEVLVSK